MDILQFTRNNLPVVESRKRFEKDLVESLITKEKSPFDDLQDFQRLLVENDSAVLWDSRDTNKNNLRQSIHHVKQDVESETNLPAITIDSQTEPCHDPDLQNLPAVVLYKIFSRLSFNDRLSASAVCWNWRESFFDARLWQDTCVTFCFGDSLEITRSRFLVSRVSQCVRNVSLRRVMNTYSSAFIQVLRQLSNNSNLKKLSFDLTFFTNAETTIISDDENIDSPAWGRMVYSAIVDIVQNSSTLKKLVLGGVTHNLAEIASLPDRLSARQKRHLTHLGLASLLEVQDMSCRGRHEPLLNLTDFTSLTTLTLNYSDLSDRLLYSLTGGALERLVVHVHGWSPNHPDTTDAAWQTFRINNPRCGLRLRILRSGAAVAHAHLILKPSMPLTHFEALFCECASYVVIERLILGYKGIIKSISWIDLPSKQYYRFLTEDDRIGQIIDTAYDVYHKCRSVLDEFIYTGHYVNDVNDRGSVFLVISITERFCDIRYLEEEKSLIGSSFPHNLGHFRSVLRSVGEDSKLFALLLSALLDRDSRDVIFSLMKDDTN